MFECKILLFIIKLQINFCDNSTCILVKDLVGSGTIISQIITLFAIRWQNFKLRAEKC